VTALVVGVDAEAVDRHGDVENISGFAIFQDGSATLVDPDGVTAQTGGNPTDAVLSHDNQFLYVRIY
jgi:hypothetical protein